MRRTKNETDTVLFESQKADVEAYLERNRRREEEPLELGYIRVHRYTDTTAEPFMQNGGHQLYRIPHHEQVIDIAAADILDYRGGILGKNKTKLILKEVWHIVYGGIYGTAHGLWVMEDRETIEEKIAENGERLRKAYPNGFRGGFVGVVEEEEEEEE